MRPIGHKPKTLYPNCREVELSTFISSSVVMDTSWLFTGVQFRKSRVIKDLQLLKGDKPSVLSATALSTISDDGAGIHVPEKQREPAKRKRERPLGSASVEEGISIFNPLLVTHRSVKKQKVQPKESAKSGIPAEEAAAVLRKKYQIHVAGHDIPPALEGFHELETRYQCKPYVMSNILESGYQEPTPIQRQAIPVILADRECLACAPTGTGKTLSFVVPILMKLKVRKNEIRAVILCPTRELAVQTAREFRRLSEGKKLKVRAMTKALFQRGDLITMQCDVLVSTPRRLAILLERSKVDLSRVTHLVLDEADKLFEMGFVKEIDAVVTACSNTEVVRSLFSATLPDTVEELARTIMHDAVRITVGEKNSASRTVKQKLMFVGSEDGKILALQQIFREKDFLPPAIIFVQSKERAKELHEELLLEGVNVDSIHAGRSQYQRTMAIENFEAGKTWVLIATDVVARGVDFKDVNIVINFDVPTCTIDYVHRIGRCGRAGKEGRAVTLYTEKDAQFLRPLASAMALSGSDVPKWMLSLPRKRYNKRRPPTRKKITQSPFS